VHGTGEVDGELRAYGRSKALDGVARQVVLGVVQTAEGLPLDFEVFEGNVAEVKTLRPMLERLLTHYPIQRVVLVAGRGLLSLENVKAIEALSLPSGRKVEYILAVPAGRYRDFAQIIQAMAFDAQGESLREAAYDGKRLVVAHRPDMARAQRARRRQTLDELIAFGERLAHKLEAQEAGHNERGRRASDRGAYSRFARAVYEAGVSRYITPALESERFSFSVHEQALAEAERLDGKLVLLTNVEDLPAEEILARYKALADIERGFRVLKSDIEIAPIYHYKPARIRAHALICFLALVLHRVIRMRLRQRHAPYSVERALEKLKAIQLHRVRFGHRTYRGLTRMSAEQLELFELLEVKRPDADTL